MKLLFEALIRGTLTILQVSSKPTFRTVITSKDHADSSKSVTSYYMSYIFINALGISELLSRILAACGSVDYLIFACLAYFVIERYGRRKVMMWSAAACSICWICISIALGLSEKGGDSYVLGSVAVAFFFLFFASFGMGVLGGELKHCNCGIWSTVLTKPTVPWLYPTEINALEMRTKGTARAYSALLHCILTIAQVQVWPWPPIGFA